MFLLAIPITENEQRVHARVIRGAIERAYGSINAACWDMVDDGTGNVTAQKVASFQANFTKELSGERALRMLPLMRLRADFWRWYGVLIAAEFGLPVELDVAERLKVGTKRMARMAAKVPQKRSA